MSLYERHAFVMFGGKGEDDNMILSIISITHYLIKERCFISFFQTTNDHD